MITLTLDSQTPVSGKADFLLACCELLQSLAVDASVFHGYLQHLNSPDALYIGGGGGGKSSKDNV